VGAPVPPLFVPDCDGVVLVDGVEEDEDEDEEGAAVVAVPVDSAAGLGGW
jgi:hypothetical protein